MVEQFSRAHRGWLTRVVRVSPGPEFVSDTDWHLLDSLTVIRTGTYAAAICVNLQGVPTVSVRAPRTLGVDRREDGAERGLEIDAAGGEFVRIVFRASARPEEVDAIAPAELREPRKPAAVPDRQSLPRDRPRVRIEERHVSK